MHAGSIRISSNTLQKDFLLTLTQENGMIRTFLIAQAKNDKRTFLFLLNGVCLSEFVHLGLSLFFFCPLLLPSYFLLSNFLIVLFVSSHRLLPFSFLLCLFLFLMLSNMNSETLAKMCTELNMKRHEFLHEKAEKMNYLTEVFFSLK